MTTNRKTARERLGALLSAALVGDGLPLAAFHDYRLKAITVAPVGFVTSAATTDNSPNQHVENVEFSYDIHIITPYSDGEDYGPDDAEDTIDDVETIIRDTLRSNRTDGAWSHCIYEGPTVASDIDFEDDGYWYRREIIRVHVQVEGG